MNKNYVIGDIQGCYKGLRASLKKVKFNPNEDKLWAVGDLIARGPDSLSTLEYLHDLGTQFDTVLGNHDLHLVATAFGINTPKPQDRLNSLIKDKYFDKYIDFLLTKPLAIKPNENSIITHAGLYPKWSFKKALALSDEIQAQLTGSNPKNVLANMYGNIPNAWDKSLTGHARNRFIVNAFTRMRYLNHDYSLDFKSKCHPSYADKEIIPWYLALNPKLKAKQTIYFGHWAALLGEIPSKTPNPAKILALDTGYVWGNKLSIFCIEDKKLFQYQA